MLPVCAMAPKVCYREAQMRCSSRKLAVHESFKEFRELLRKVEGEHMHVLQPTQEQSAPTTVHSFFGRRKKDRHSLHMGAFYLTRPHRR